MSGKNFMSYGDADTILTEFSNDIKSRVSTKANQGLTAQQIANAKANIDIDKVPNVATNDQTPTFLEESTRTNIASGDKLSLIFGKIKKFFSDLKTVAFSGSYNDLTDKIVFDNAPTQNSDNAVKSGGIFNSMAVFKYDSVNKRGYFVGGSAFGGNIDSSPTAGSNNAVASGGTKMYVDNKILIETLTVSEALTIASQTYGRIQKLCTKEGYTPIGIVGCTGSGTGYLSLVEFYISGGYANVYYYNSTSSAKTISSYRLQILYIKN